MFTVVENEHDEPRSKPWTKLLTFLHSANTSVKAMTPIILSPAICKNKGRQCSLTVMATGLAEGNLSSNLLNSDKN